MGSCQVWITITFNQIPLDTFACTSRREIFKDILNGKNSDELFFHKHGFYAFDTAGKVSAERDI